MAIYRLLREAAFNPEQVKQMTAAYETALRKLELVDRSDPVTELIARKIIEIARSGERSATAICDRALEELGVSPKQPT
jgi:hypothetical protein